MNWHDSDHRSSSPQAYLTPVEGQRTNWVTLTTHLVSLVFVYHYPMRLIRILLPGYQDQLGEFWCSFDSLWH